MGKMLFTEISDYIDKMDIKKEFYGFNRVDVYFKIQELCEQYQKIAEEQIAEHRQETRERIRELEQKVDTLEQEKRKFSRRLRHREDELEMLKQDLEGSYGKGAAQIRTNTADGEAEKLDQRKQQLEQEIAQKEKLLQQLSQKLLEAQEILSAGNILDDK